MNHSALLKRAYQLTLRYRVLWIFGILIALTTGGGASGGNNGLRYQFDRSDFQRWNMPHWAPGQQWFDQAEQWFRHFDPARYVGLIVACCCLLVILTIFMILVQLVARAALMRSVDQIEVSGGAPTWRQGFRLGWSRRTFRLFLLELVVGLVVMVAALALMALAGSPLLLFLARTELASIIAIILTVILGLPVILILIAAAIALSVLGQFWARAVVLRDLGIGEALRQGYALVRARLRDLGVLWLLMAGIGIAFTILAIPVFLVAALIAGLIGGGLGYAVYAVGGSIPWAVGIGAPIFLLLLTIPMAFVGGLYETFKSGVWTLAYREVTQ